MLEIIVVILTLLLGVFIPVVATTIPPWHVSAENRECLSTVAWFYTLSFMLIFVVSVIILWAGGHL